MRTYNGHPSYRYWNVALWIGNDEGLYHLALDCIRSSQSRRQAADAMLESLRESAAPGREPETPDGAKYSQRTILHAMRGMR